MPIRVANDGNNSSTAEPPLRADADGGVLVTCRLRSAPGEQDGDDRAPTVRVYVESVDDSTRENRDATTGQCVVVEPLGSSRSNANRVQRFRLDTVFSAKATQAEVFASVGTPAVRDVLRGYNCTILAYGQTGSGKTYTTVGPERSAKDGDDSQRGLIPRIMDELFHGISSCTDTKLESVSVTASFLEVYQEKLRDLLQPGNSSSLRIREQPGDYVHDVQREGKMRAQPSPSMNVWVDGATEITLTSARMGEQVLARGCSNRAVGATRMNGDSSRSHAVFALTVSVCSNSGHNDGGDSNSDTGKPPRRRRARLCMVDLAGSEKATKTAASDQRLDEAKHINKSLSALGNVIHALTSETNTTSSSVKTGVSASLPYVPYRASKLTRLLQSSLGGNAKTHLVLTCSSAARHVHETLATLRFGQRAKYMPNHPHVNATGSSSTSASNERLRVLENKIQSLCHYIRQLEARVTAPSPTSSSCPQCPHCSSQSVNTECEPQDDDALDELDSASSLKAETIEEDEEDQENPNEDDPQELRLGDELMQAELSALRSALKELQHQQHMRDHASTVAQYVDEVESCSLVDLRHEQEKRLQRQELQIRDADSQISALQAAVRAMRTSREEDARVAARDCEGLVAENEILRRRLEKLEIQATQWQTRHDTAALDAVALREDANRNEIQCRRLQHELEELATQLQLARANSSDLPKESSPQQEQEQEQEQQPQPFPIPIPHRRPVTALELASSRAGGNTLAIQSWWAGDQCLVYDQDIPVVNTGFENHESPGYRALPSRREGNRVPLAASSLGRSRVVHTSTSGTRPLRARLVGLLNSLEEETSSYKELVGTTVVGGRHGPTTSDGDQPRPHPAASHRLRRHGSKNLRLPGLATSPPARADHGHKQE